MDAIEKIYRERVERYRKVLRKDAAGKLTDTEAAELGDLCAVLGIILQPNEKLVPPDQIDRSLAWHRKMIRDCIALEQEILTDNDVKLATAQITKLGKAVEKIQPEFERIQREYQTACAEKDKFELEWKQRQGRSKTAPRSLASTAATFPLLLDAPWPVETPKEKTHAPPDERWDPYFRGPREVSSQLSGVM